MIRPKSSADRPAGFRLRSLFKSRNRVRKEGARSGRFKAQVARLEERQLMSAAPLEMPLAPAGSPGRYDTVASLSDVLFTGNNVVGDVPIKTLTLYNNTADTV